MKRIIVSLVAVVIAAGTSFAQASIGAGYLNSTSTTKVGDRSTSSDPINGFYAGVGYTMPLGPVNFTPGFYFSAMSKESTSSIGGFVSGTGKLTEMYMNVPLDFSFGVDLNGNLRVFAYAGPTVNVGLVSSYKLSGNIAGVGIEKEATDLYADSDYSRFDVLAGGGIGLDIMNLVRVTAGYNYGLLNRSKAENTTLHRSEINAGLAFLF